MLTTESLRAPALIFLIGHHETKNRVSAIVSESLSLPCVSVYEQAYQRSEDLTYPRSQGLKSCLEEKVNLPVTWTHELLEDGIKNTNGRLILITDFPETKQQLLGLKKKAQDYENPSSRTDTTRPFEISDIFPFEMQKISGTEGQITEAALRLIRSFTLSQA
ncbi:adenylate kinase [Penicillium hetheringtonii]|uniref:Adenylate kinase n=1 Tax=Penicillium hetheringtonii TaxID=911720 RepID=A0AAD6GP77_9EURO|nr:adenylate kinase [Penicillium hetheringtonii]